MPPILTNVAACSTCKYIVGIYCCRYPPTVVAPNVQMWPVVAGDDWCGEWSAGSSNFPGMTVTPDTATAASGTLVTINDINGGLMSTTAVDIGGNCGGVSVMSDTQVTCRTPYTGSAGTYQVKVTAATGTIAGPDFTYT